MLRSETHPVGVNGRWSTEQTHIGAVPERTYNQWNPGVRLYSDQIRRSIETQQGGPVVWVSFDKHNLTHCVMSSCVLDSSPNPRVGGDRWKTAPYVIGWPSATQPAAAKKLSQFQLFALQPAVLFSGSCSGSDCHCQNRRASFKWMKKPAF